MTQTITAGQLLNERDITFMLYEWLGAQDLCARPQFAEHSRETFDAALEIYSRIAIDLFAPHNKKGDQTEPRIENGMVSVIPEVAVALAAFCEAGLMAAAQAPAHGGMGLPVLVERAGFAWLMAANPATAGFALLTIANVNLLLANGSPEQIEDYVGPMLTGRCFGTMCLSETQAGSSLGDIATRAEPRPDGSHRLFGTKMWISAGDHEVAENIVHLVLARMRDAPLGARGLSLFLVPKRLPGSASDGGERNDVSVAGLNHKMGFRGIPNTVLVFGDGSWQPFGEPGAIGYLVGQPGQGLPCMFHMMNEARISVGLGATAIGYAGYRHALDYARQRAQGRAIGNKNPSSRPVPIIEHADVKRMLLAQKAYVEGALALCLYCARLVDEERTAETTGERHTASRLLGILTPIVKSWPSQWCLEANNLAIQVHGGYGYTRDYNVEQFYRDNRLNAIHEGTHGIQAIDFVGRQLSLHGGAALGSLLDRMRQTASAASGIGTARLAEFAVALSGVIERLTHVAAKLVSQPEPAISLANATPVLEAFGHAVIAWIWLDQATAIGAAGRESADDFYRGKLQACQYFFRWELPRVGALIDAVERGDATVAAMTETWF